MFFLKGNSLATNSLKQGGTNNEYFREISAALWGERGDSSSLHGWCWGEAGDGPRLSCRSAGRGVDWQGANRLAGCSSLPPPLHPAPLSTARAQGGAGATSQWGTGAPTSPTPGACPRPAAGDLGKWPAPGSRCRCV